MTISKDLYLAILSMDAYNRGYGAGIADGQGEKDVEGNDLDGLGIGGRIGKTSIKPLDDLGISQNEYSAWQAAGFYAVAYRVEGVEGIADGTTVISYRGTDFTPDPGMADDIRDGWPVGGGNYYELQSLMATDFLDAVQADDRPSSILLTGHSLGGGLAA